MASFEQNRIHGVIDIGSSRTTLKIGQTDNDKPRLLEVVKAPLPIGREVFSTGHISAQTSKKLCTILSGFRDLLQAYDVQEPDIVATTAVREAVNREYFIEQVLNKTGILIRVLDDPEEKNIIYGELLRNESKNKGPKNRHSVMVYVGTGSLGIVQIRNEKVAYAQNIRTGSLRLSEILEPTQGYTNKFHVIVEEYIATFIDTIDNVAHIKKAEKFVASGKEMNVITGMILKNATDSIRQEITYDDFAAFYDRIKHLPPDQIAQKYNLSYELAETVIPFIALFKLLVELTEANRIVSRNDTLAEALIYQRLYPNQMHAWAQRFEKSIIHQAKKIATRFAYDKRHATAVERNALCLFDHLQKLHRMSNEERRFLKVACILHDIGKFINIKSHYVHSYNIIRNLDILGLSDNELTLIANISRYHSDSVPNLHDENYRALTVPERVTVSKLIAMIRLADALDKSHTQKFDVPDVTLLDDTLTVTCKSAVDCQLEVWAFLKKSEFFKHVFGIDAKLIIERTY